MKINKHLFSVIVIIGFSIISNAQIPNYVPSNGLDGWWPFNGNTNDESGNNNNGTVNGATLTNDRFGNVGQAYGFDGINDNISLNNTFFNGSSDVLQLTFSVWIYCTALPVNSSAFISGKEGYWRSKYLFIEPDGSIHFGRTQPNPQTYIDVNSGVNSIQLNSWQNIIITFIGGNLNMYINGDLIASSIIPYMSLDYSYLLQGNATNTNLIGAVNPASGLSDFFTGKIDDMGMWNRVLTQCEIQDLYTSQENSTFVSAGADQTICNGEQVTLSASNSQNYSWDNGVTDNVSFSPTTTQDYIVNADTVSCQSSDTVTIFVNQPSSSILSLTALDSYTLNGQTYTQSGTYTQVILASNGCDSTITLNLILNFTGIHELGNTTKTLVKIIDLNGKIIQRRKNTVMLFIYEDGTVERVVEIE